MPTDFDLFTYRTRKIVMYPDLNGAGTLFGGRALSWIDEEAAIFAASLIADPHPKLVTAHMDAINFVAPGRLNDMLEIGCTLIKVGRTSITVNAAIRNLSTKDTILSAENIVFVNIGEDGKPAPVKMRYE